METTKARREAAVLFFIVFVLGALFGAAGVHVWAQRVSGEPAVVSNNHPTREQMIDSFSQEVQLTAEQRQQLGAIMDDTVAKWKMLYAPLDVQREAIRQQGRDRIRGILTPEQVPKFEDYMRRVDEQRKKEAAAAAASSSH
jgi:Spy/CpxP family protein refolding chaperone